MADPLAPGYTPTHHISYPTIGTTATVISIARSGRTLVIQNQSTTLDVWLGDSGVTANNGFKLAAFTGAQPNSLTDDSTISQWYAYCSSSMSNLMVDEIY